MRQQPEKPMKLLLPLLMLMASSATIAGAVELQTDAAPISPESEAVGHSANDVLDIMAKRLSLTDDQKSKILPIIAERRQKIQEVRTTSTLPRRQKMSQVRGIYEDSDKRINALLTAEQQKGYAAFEQEMRAKQRNQRSERATPAN
jgi:Spy/CpxP family protein refolding chaperone